MNDSDLDFKNLYEKYYSPICRYMSTMVGPTDSADVTQEIFAKIGRGLKNFEGRAKLSTWIYRIATNTALDWLRSRQSKQSDISLQEDLVALTPGLDVQISSVIQGPLELAISSEMNDCIRQQVNKLPEKYRTVMILSSLQEHHNQQIADILDISIDSVKIRLHRGRIMLKKILEVECRFYSNPSTGALACDRKAPSLS